MLTGFARRSDIVDSMTDSVARLYDAVVAVRGSDPEKSRTARLLRAGRAKMAKKLAEEAVEVVIDAMHGQPRLVGKAPTCFTISWCFGSTPVCIPSRSGPRCAGAN